MMPRLLIISHDVVGRNMAGPGIRASETARVLATQQPVTLLAREPIDVADAPFATGSYGWGDPASLAPWLADADVVLANGYVLQAHPELAGIPQPLALDLYDPVLLENLELFRSAPPAERDQRTQTDIDLLGRQLAAGDFFACATERQRDLLLGGLMLAGRITPAATDADPHLRQLIDVVPFGLPTAPPIKHAPALRGVIPGIDPDDRIVLWTGGLWDWLDPLTLIRATPQLIAEQPDARIVFLAGQHPGNVVKMQMPERARALAAELGLLDRHIFFYDQWIAYERRADFLLEADVAVSLHRDHLETRYAAVRSRFLDHLWAGLPSLVTGGDAAAELVREHDLGRVVATEDVGQTAAALLHLLGDDKARQRYAANARALAAQFTWERAVEPLGRFCREPHRRRAAQKPDPAPQKVEQPMEQLKSPLSPGELALDRSRNAAIGAQEQTWRIAERPVGGGIFNRVRQLLINQLVRPFVLPLIEQQQEHNAAVLRTTYALAESADRRRSAINEQLAALHQRINELYERTDRLAQGEQTIRQQVGEFAEQLAGLEEADTQLLELTNGLRQTATRKP
jgi:glycosyltransferase involved in cell wall biosynthesis